MAGWWDRVRENRDISALSAITNLVRTGITLIILVGGVVLSILVFPGVVHLLLFGLASVVPMALVLWAFVTIRRTYKARLGDWNPGIWVTERKTICKVQNQHTIDYENILTLKFLNNDTSVFNWRFNWTGDGEVNISLQNSKFTYVLEDLAEANSHVLRILFDKPRSRGHVETVEFTIQTRGTRAVQRPFCAMTFYESRLPKKAELVVEFVDGVPIGTVQKEVYASPKLIWPTDPPEHVTLDKTRTVTWPLKCRRDYRYSVKWVYDE